MGLKDKSMGLTNYQIGILAVVSIAFGVMLVLHLRKSGHLSWPD